MNATKPREVAEGDLVTVEKEITTSQSLSTSKSGRSVTASEDGKRKDYLPPPNEVLPCASNDTCDEKLDSLHKAYAFLCHYSIQVISDICVRWEMSSTGSKG